MRLTVIVVAAVTALASSAAAQSPSTLPGADAWAEFMSSEDGFRITFPGKPAMKDVVWTSQMGYQLPARIFSVDRGREHYSLTVADYRGIEKLGVAKSQSCTPGAETCIGGQTRIVGPGSRTSASIYMHDNRLYVIEGDVPKGYPEPELFKMSIGFIRSDGTESNIYSQVYNNYMGLGESPLPDLCGLRGCNAVGLGSGAAAASAVKPRTRREDFPGLANYFPIDGTASNGGLVQSAEWVASELWRRGFKTVIDVDPGRDGNVFAAVATSTGLRYVPMPFDPSKVDAALKTINERANQPVFLHSANGRTSAALWMIKRVLSDGWTVEQAGAEATTIGLVNDDPSVPPLWKFAHDYTAAHLKK